jgi:periplasmic divalent cation tolerance protein
MTSTPLHDRGHTASLIYITCGSRDEATTIARAVVEERLAACANIIDGMHAIYWWEGKVAEDEETVLILKTTADRVGTLTGRVQALHSYDLPCVVEIPLGSGGNTAYLDWIAAETAEV